ncbi:MAG: T9SS type A sorting domain-containing protein [Ignavibacteriaceae bacterium]|nr:T9SS type A sorting domain-containing protein [Ignavibacteriaceae bacterium]
MVWRSTNNGATWDAVYGNSGDKLIYTITSTNNDVIFAGGNDGEIVRSTDFGETWISSNVGIPADAYCKIIRVSENGLIFLGTLNYGIFRSIDGGLSWNGINNGLNSLEITSISINSLGKIFAGTLNGVFVSTDDGDNWSPRNSGLIDISILSLICDSSDYLFAATMSTGVYRSFYPTTAVENESDNVPSTFSLYQNYPNPFNPTTTIAYEIPERGFVTLKVYDVLGREVATLLNEEKPAGSYKIEFNGTSLTSGIYFYQLNAGNYSETRKMILLR